MKFQLNQMLIVVAVLLALWVFVPRFRSGYAEITTNLGDMVPDLFSNKQAQDCLPGQGATGDYYTSERSLGLCEGMKYVHKLGHEYKIVDK
jgi:hypothetical protein